MHFFNSTCYIYLSLISITNLVPKNNSYIEQHDKIRERRENSFASTVQVIGFQSIGIIFDGFSSLQ